MFKKISLLLVFLPFILTGCGNQTITTNTTTTSNTITTSSNSVTIQNFAFTPQELTVTAGTTVTWTNNDNMIHTIVSQNLFESKILNKGDKFSFTFTTLGEFDYICDIHPSIKGKIIVK